MVCNCLNLILVTLLSKPPEVQYVALRNISLVLQKVPNLLQSEIESFFCNFNDAVYVKMEKLEIIFLLVNEKNTDAILRELKTYSTKYIDVEFVRKSVKTIGRVAVKITSSAEKCVHVLVDLIKNGQHRHYVIEEAIIVLKDIFRKYPNTYESIIPALCEYIDALDAPEARAALIWMLGEYCDCIEEAQEILQDFGENIKEESGEVQLQTLTAVVKLFLQNPKDNKELIQQVLKIATEGIDLY